MRRSIGLGCALAVLTFSAVVAAQADDVAKPSMVLRQTVEGLPRSEKQELRVLTASFKPGDRTVFHTHRFPVTVYVLEGAFTLELEGRPPVTVKVGEAFVEPPHVRMTGYNRSPDQPLNVVIFYVSDLDTPFLDLVH